MKTEILISSDDWENRVAVLEEGSLAEIYFEREEKVIGSIYKGRVENVLPGMGASFVNIGLGRNAFLYVDDIMRDPINIGETEITDRRKGHTVNELLKVGSDVLVQVVKEPRGLKGARVSTNISLPGRYLVLMPTGRYSGVSSRIEDPNERTRLKQILRRVRPEGMATIVRTAAQGVSEAELIADLGVQLRLWHGILESYKRSTAPALLHKDLNLVFKAVRDFLTSDVTAVYIDSREQFEEIRSTMSLLGPQYIERLKLVEGPGTLFEARGIDEELQRLLKPKIPLPSGGHLVLEHTEALTVIDVNTGKFTGGRNLEDTIVRTNLEAAAEIARQVRLRDIGGIIVVDFIDMAKERSREQVIGTLTASLRRDRTRSTIQEFSNLGLLEFTRKRVGKDLAGQLRSECPYCSGLGTVMSSETLAIGVLRQLRGWATNGHNGHRVKKLDVVSDASVATQLLGWYREELQRLVHDHDLEVGLFVEPTRHREHVVVEEARRLRPAPQPGMVVEAELLPVRLPNPASGVAVINGYLVEIKDGANGAGQTVKIKIGSLDENLVHAELAEPLQLGQRRRRRERGRKAVQETPVAPPVPAVASVDRRREPIVAEREEEEEEPVRRRATARGGRTAARPAARSRASSVEEEGRGRQGRRRSGSRGNGYPPPLVVGGEGDIDYEDDEEAAAPRARVAASDEEDAESGAPRRRRRRRGRGKGRVAAGEAGRPEGSADEEEADLDEAVVMPSRPVPATAGRRPAPRYERDEEEDETEDLEAVVTPRRGAAPPPRQQRRYGEVRQLYGKPLAPEEQRRQSQARSATPRPRRREEEDDLEVVVKPRAPSAIHVDVHPARPDGERRPRPERERERRPPARTREPEFERRPPRTDEGRGFERREPREERGGGERRGGRGGERGGERGGGRGRRDGRGDRGEGRPRRTGPAVKQLYPPPDQERPEEGAADEERSPRASKAPRGPLARPANAPPVPKGKVRQLYPPPDFDAEEAAKSARGPSPRDLVDEDEDIESEAFDARSSLFVNDAEELEERRQRARERAEARRRTETTAGDEPKLDSTTEFKAIDDLPDNDEWPAF